MTIIAKMFHLH